MEYVALGEETPLTELPSFKSMLKRTGQHSVFNDRHASTRALRPFLQEEFRNILRTFIPYSLLGVGLTITDVRVYPTEFQAVVLCIVLVAACLAGSMFVRQRILFVALASFGFFWSLPMRNTVVFHEFEALYYVGLPLVFFTIALLLARRLTNRDGIIVAASVVAMMLFAVSSFQMSRLGHPSNVAQAAKTEGQDLLAIHKLVAREPVTVRPSKDIPARGSVIYYYLNSIVMDKEYYPSMDGGFIVMHHRIDTDALLTPQNRRYFLYNGPDLIASYRSTYPWITSTEPLAREDFDLYLIDGTMHYIKETCHREDTRSRFFLHVFPEDIDDLPDDRKEWGFDNLDFHFVGRGLFFDGKCIASVDLPQYEIAGFRTGSHEGDAAVWRVAHVIQAPKLFSAYPSIVSREPIARSEFDLYLDDGKLYYVKEPCDSEDVQVGFFLHIIPADPDDLPDARKQYGFDNLDFGFDVRGVMFDGKCVAGVDLPQYAIAQATTGQFDGAGRIWAVELAQDELE